MRLILCEFEIYDTWSIMVSLNQIAKLTSSSCLLRTRIILPVGRSYSKQAKEAFKIWSIEAI